MNTTLQHQLLIKTARALQQQYDQFDLRPPPIVLPSEPLDRLQRLYRQCQLARQHGYLAALQRCRRLLSDTLQMVQHHFSSLKVELDQTRSLPA